MRQTYVPLAERVAGHEGVRVHVIVHGSGNFPDVQRGQQPQERRGERGEDRRVGAGARGHLVRKK